MTVEPEGRAALARGCRWAGGIGIAAIAIMRCAVVFVPQVAFDTDPGADAVPLAGLGPAGSLWLDVLLLLCAAAVHLGEFLRGRRIDWVLVLLAALPVPVVLWHGLHDAGDLWRGSVWVSALFAGVALAHLAGDRCLRPLLVAMLTAVVVPLLVRAAVQVWHEHPPTVALFEQTKESFLANQGWEPGSPSALIYERRLRQPAPTTWFLSSNVFASFAAFALTWGLGLAILSWRSGVGRTSVALAGGLAVAATVGLWLSGSKGGLGVGAIGAALVVLPAVSARSRRVLFTSGGVVALALVAALLLGVIVRSALLPESFAGDRSLLFRGHYLFASVRILAEHPWIGVGADSFQDAYMPVRHPRSPEQVTSAHNVFADWLTMLGALAQAGSR